MIPARVPTTDRKVAGLKSESVTGFIPESWPASFRNGGRDDFGTVAALPRNTQPGGQSRRKLRPWRFLARVSIHESDYPVPIVQEGNRGHKRLVIFVLDWKRQRSLG